MERDAAAGDPDALPKLRRDRCRSGQCCAHRVELSPREASTLEYVACTLKNDPDGSYGTSMNYSMALQRSVAVDAGRRLLDMIEPLSSRDRRIHCKADPDATRTMCGSVIRRKATWLCVMPPSEATCVECLRAAYREAIRIVAARAMR